MRDTARLLWGLYVGLTAVLVLLLAAYGWLGLDDRMNLYEAVANAFGTMPTGGFSTQPDSVASFSAETQWTLAAFMLIAGSNYVILYRALVRRQPGRLVGDEELRLYVVIALLASAVLAAQLWGHGVAEGEAAARAGAFQAVSIITTTGLASTDFALWPALSLLTIFALMFVGGSAGSTAGSIKVVRHLLLGKILRRDLHQTLSPERVLPIRLNGSSVDEKALRAISGFILLYVGAWAIGGTIIAIDGAITGAGLGTLDALTVSATALGNVGPGLGPTGPFGSFAPLGDVSKITMIGLMWLGRLEILPVIVLLTRHYWRH